MKFSPKNIVSYLDKYVIGQDAAKRILAISIRNRHRVLQIKDTKIKEAISPRNVLLIGATGVGKTRLVSCLCKMNQSPFVKIDATRFTEVGYVGRDVESMIHDLIERSIVLQKEKYWLSRTEEQKEEEVLRKIATSLLRKQNKTVKEDTIKNCIKEFKEKKHDDTIIEVEICEKGSDKSDPNVLNDRGSLNGVATMGVVPFGDLLKVFSGHKDQVRRLEARKAYELLLQNADNANSINNEDIVPDAMKVAATEGIVFIDELDKLISSKENGSRGDVSREGVQRDLLPIVEGTTVQTKYGLFDTSNVLFVAAGAFHSVKPSDLLIELQGRFPTQAKLESLGVDDFVKILTIPEISLIKQVQALLLVDGVELKFTDDAIVAIAEHAAKMNSFFDNIGARRLQGVLSSVVEEISFSSSKEDNKSILIDKDYVGNALKKVSRDDINRKEDYII